MTRNFLRKGAVAALIFMFVAMFTVAASAQTSSCPPPISPGGKIDPATCAETFSGPGDAISNSAQPGQLALTGSETGLMTGLAIALIVLGFGLTRITASGAKGTRKDALSHTHLTNRLCLCLN